jgi:hypothetical protein
MRYSTSEKQYLKTSLILDIANKQLLTNTHPPSPIFFLFATGKASLLVGKCFWPWLGACRLLPFKPVMKWKIMTKNKGFKSSIFKCLTKTTLSGICLIRKHGQQITGLTLTGGIIISN